MNFFFYKIVPIVAALYMLHVEHYWVCLLWVGLGLIYYIGDYLIDRQCKKIMKRIDAIMSPFSESINGTHTKT